MLIKNERPHKGRVSARLREIPEAELQRVTGGIVIDGVTLPNGNPFPGLAALDTVAGAVLRERFGATTG